MEAYSCKPFFHFYLGSIDDMKRSGTSEEECGGGGELVAFFKWGVCPETKIGIIYDDGVSGSIRNAVRLDAKGS